MNKSAQVAEELVEIESGTICIVIDPHMLNESKGAEYT